MKVSQTDRTDKITRSFDIEDGPVLPFPYSRAGKTFRVKTVVIEYTSRGGGGAWAIQGTFSVQLTGPVLRKDGTEGKETYNGRPESDAALGDLPHYRWLRSLIGVARPYGKANALIVNELGLEG